MGISTFQLQFADLMIDFFISSIEPQKNLTVTIGHFHGLLIYQIHQSFLELQHFLL